MRFGLRPFNANILAQGNRMMLLPEQHEGGRGFMSIKG